MSSIAQNTGAIIGPALAGVVIATLGQEYTYLFNAISFLAVIVALILMGAVLQDMRHAPGINLKAALEGVRFIFKKKIILSTMLMDFVATFFASANTMMPIVARDILKVGEIGFGWLSSAQSIGSVITGLILSQIRHIRRQGALFLSAVTFYGLATVLFGFSSWLGPSVILFSLPAFQVTLSFMVAFFSLVLIGSADTVSTIIRNTIRQLNTPDHIRGRMVSVSMVFFQGGPQLGEVEAGIVGTLIGVPFAIITGGIGCILGVVLIVLKWPELRRYNGDEHLAVSPAA
jgi:MFS family permease